MTGKQTWTLALAALLVCVPLSACGAKESPLPDAATYDTGDDSGWETVEGGEVLMENDDRPGVLPVRRRHHPFHRHR